MKILLAATSVAVLAKPAFAQDSTGPNVDELAAGQSGGVAQYNLAQGLYAIGRANKDALMALTAAKLAAGIEMTDVERDLTQQTGKDVAEENGGEDAPADATMMLAAARDYSAGDETLLDLIDSAEAEATRNRVGGASRQLSTLPAGAVEAWKIPFYGDSFAEIGVFGDGDTPLLVIVTDENGNRVGCPARVFDRFYCDFVPKWNGYFNVTVSNQGSRSNSYYLLTN
jgi:hypothetical protein